MPTPAETRQAAQARAYAFVEKWKGESRERAEDQSFWNDFFDIFGIDRKTSDIEFQRRVRLDIDRVGWVDVLWPGQLLIEHKSRGKDLEGALVQAIKYWNALPREDRTPYILLCDFHRFVLYKPNGRYDKVAEFTLPELPERLEAFEALFAWREAFFREQENVHFRAAEKMGQLFDRLRKTNPGRDADIQELLIRTLFCLFAENTGIFNKGQFTDYIRQNNSSGEHLSGRFPELFDVLNSPTESRPQGLREALAGFPYINGQLFERTLRPVVFDSKGYKTLLECAALDWGKISPAIFGSLFQAAMDPQLRRHLGAHYTTEDNILKAVAPILTEPFEAELAAARGNPNRLANLHDRLCQVRVLDPACGSGNFLILAYRELRYLEIELLAERYKNAKPLAQLSETRAHLSRVDVDQFYGIELDPLAAHIAEVALWMMDHLMNRKLAQRLGHYQPRIPLRKSPNIQNANALRIDWHTLETNGPITHIVGNPPFVGSKMMTTHQRDDLLAVAPDVRNAATLDYVSGWYFKAAHFIQHTQIPVAFVSTNSIVQGEQVATMWEPLLKRGIVIHFAHQTFKWRNEGSGMAHVYCVVVGFGAWDKPGKFLYDYAKPDDEHPTKRPAQHINPYLLDFPDVLVTKRNRPLDPSTPEMSFGNMPLDGNHLLLTPEEKAEFERNEPQALPYIRPLLSAWEYINGQERWCLWLEDLEPSQLRKMPLTRARVEAVRAWRLAPGRAPSTRKFAETPALFRDRNTPQQFILVPSTSSERREYIPIGFFSGNYVANNSCHIIPNASLYHFGILTSRMHMAWMRYTCGRLKSDYRYSKFIVYNNFPWPTGATPKQRAKVEALAQAVLQARQAYPNSTLADLYDPLAMPLDLRKAHRALDQAVDRLYRPEAFANEHARIQFLFGLYAQQAGLTLSP